MSHLRHVALYGALVGLPLLGLVGVLKVGDRLVPPPSIGGSWRIEHEGTEGSRRLERLLTHANPIVTIRQSGERFELRPGGEDQPAVTGTLVGRTITATHRGDDRVDWIFSADLGPTPDVMTGSIVFVATTSTVARFVAVREHGTRGKD